jgi:hypothetical protein
MRMRIPSAIKFWLLFLPLDQSAVGTKFNSALDGDWQVKLSLADYAHARRGNARGRATYRRLEISYLSEARSLYSWRRFPVGNPCVPKFPSPESWQEDRATPSYVQQSVAIAIGSRRFHLGLASTSIHRSFVFAIIKGGRPVIRKVCNCDGRVL